MDPSTLRFIFVGGAPRSGTTLVQKILDMHSMIYGGPEFDHLPALMRQCALMMNGISNNRQAYYYEKGYLTDAFGLFVRTLFSQKADKEGVNIISEKTPDNVLVFELLATIFPDAKFVFVVRDPRAILNSFINVKKRYLSSGIKQRVNIGEDIFDDLVKIHKSLRAGDDFLARYPEKGTVIYYEDLVKTPELEVERICNFIDVPYEAGMLDTTTQNDSSLLIQKRQLTEAPFVTDLFDKRIDETAANSWEDDLSAAQKIVASHFFLRHPLRCLTRYSFELAGPLGRSRFWSIFIRKRISDCVFALRTGVGRVRRMRYWIAGIDA